MKNKLEIEKTEKKKTSINICNILMLAFLLFIVAFDLITKYVVESKLALDEEAKFLPGFMSFVVVHNDGAAWNLFSGFQILLIIVTFIFLGVYFWFFFSKKSKSKLLGIASGLLLGGCIGNLYDRLFFGYVRDFLNFQFIKFPVFNIADAALCIGVLLLAIYFIFIYPKELKAEQEKLKKEGINLDQSGEINTDDLDKIKKKKFDILKALNIKKYMQKRKTKKSNIEASDETSQNTDTEDSKEEDKK